MNLQTKPQPERKLAPDLLARFAAIVGDEIRDHRPAGAGALSGRDARPLSRPHAGGAAAGLGRGSRRHPQARQRDARPRSCRRAAIPGWSAGRSRITAKCVLSLDAARQDPRGRSRLQHHDGGSRRHAAARARGGGRGRPALSAAPAVGRHLHHRRQSLDQCRRHRGARARHRALACARPRSRAGRRPRAARPQQAEEGQYRLRPEEPVHRRRRHARHHHRGGAAAGAAAALGRDGLRRRALAAGRGRSARPRRASAPPAASPRSN